MNTTDWMTRARCADPDIDPETFFPVQKRRSIMGWFAGPRAPGNSTRAKAICKTCPVTDECLLYSLLTDSRAGVWGGLSERERRNLGKETRHGTLRGYAAGCRCSECLHQHELQNRRRTEQRRAARHTTPPEHGTPRCYRDYACRCDDCKAAWAAAARAARAVKQQFVAVVGRGSDQPRKEQQ